MAQTFCISAGRNTGSGPRGFDLNEYGGTVGKRDHGAVLQGMCHESQREMTGQTISAMGVWNVIQALGEKVYNEEER